MMRVRNRSALFTAVLFGVASGVVAQDDSAAAQTSSPEPQSIEQPAAQAENPSIAAATKEKLGDLTGKVNGLEESYLATKADVDKLRKIKVSGYIQAQARMAVNYKDATGDTSYSHKANAGIYPYSVGDFSGGAFGSYMSSLFQLRRARIKVAYETDLTQAVVQIDAIPFSTVSLLDGYSLSTKREKVYEAAPGDSADVLDSVSGAGTSKVAYSGGGISLKDAYLRFNEPWLKSIAIKAGLFDRPFGFEIGYSSGSRETPERSRIFQTLFPNERDLGVSLEYLASDALPAWAQYFNFKGGLFTGNGINLETDDNRDIIGRFGVSIPITSANLAIDAGGSAYAGKVLLLNSKDTLMEFNADSLKFIRNASARRFDNVDRRYYGGDVQIYYDIPVIGGLSLRGEYIQGIQPGLVDNVGSPKSDLQSTKGVYVRNFSGYYVMWVQNIWKYNQFVLKYDVFDPNTDVSGNDVASTTELAYKTLGVGLIHHWDENVKLVLYYDHVTNETSTKFTGAKDVFQKDLYDDVLTFRIQYKF